ncbi:MAG: hypothetical protein HY814_04590, partial [Candidatus Riflebacteria bacterium]|nr:hypothetical protein [Candidatus Riflebacteria bacterium]
LMNAVPFFNDDADWYILERKQQPQWYCGLRSVDTAKDSCFSLVGDPLDPKNGGFSPFVGLVWKYTDKREPAGESSKYLSPDKRSWVEPTPDAEKDFFYSIEAEGGLVGAYNRIKFEHFSDDVLWTTYRCSVVDQVRTPYGYRWEKAYERGWFDKVFGDLFKVTVFYLFGPITGPLGLMALDSLGLVPFGTANPPPNLLSVTPTDVASVFPPGYRLYERAATRRYPSLARVLPPAQSQRPLVLDGVLWVDDLSTDTGFTYKGRGIICSTNPTVKTSDNSKGPRMALPVVPQAAAGADLSKATDYLTLVNTRDEPGKAHLGEQQLELSLVAEAGDQSASVFQGSVVSLQGVRPKEKTVSIAGNMVCGFLNKAKIPEGSRLNVNYNSTLLMGTDSTAGPKFLDGSWHVIALSPRASGWHDR